MKPLIVLIIKRNAFLTLAFLLVLIGLGFVPRRYLPPWWSIPIAFFVGLLSANGILFKQHRPIAAVALSLLLFPVLGLLVVLSSNLLLRGLVSWEYKARGFQMVNGCNGGAAVEADSQVYTLEQRIADLTDTSGVDTNKIAELHMALTIAKEKAEVLSEDCRKRGHCENKPWKANWAMIKKALAASEEGLN